MDQPIRKESSDPSDQILPKMYFSSFSADVYLHADLFDVFYSGGGKIRPLEGQLAGN